MKNENKPKSIEKKCIKTYLKELLIKNSCRPGEILLNLLENQVTQ